MDETATIPSPIAGTDTNDIVISEIVQSTRNDSSSLEILDLGAGQGYNGWKLREMLKEKKIKITCADIDNGQFKVKTDDKLTFIGFDLNKEFDFGKFDYVIATEVIEHLENPYQFLRTCLRSLKTGGTLYFTTPNVTNIYSVIKLFFSGLPYLFGVIEDKGHILPFFPFMLKFVCADFERNEGKKIKVDIFYNKNVLRLYPFRKTVRVFGNRSRLLGDSAIYKITLL